jgi:L-asparaginase II
VGRPTVTGVHPQQFSPLAIVSRNGVDESVHFGALVALNGDGIRSFSVGDPAIEIYPRSSTKPFQALAMVRAGLTLDSEHLAVVCASHNGEDIHQQIVLDILSSVGLGEGALANTHDYPLHLDSAYHAVRSGKEKSSLQMNCSGKHAGMLATCVINGWSTSDYLQPDHPLQRAITDAVTDVTGTQPPAIGVDGCGAPAHVMTLENLARGLRAIAVGDAGDAGRQIFAAMSGYPHIVGGTGRHVTGIVGAIPGLCAKDGAESVYVAAMNDGRAVALKISDGSGRATPTVLVQALSRLGIDTSLVPTSVTEVVLGHGKPVGSVRACDWDISA